MTRPVIAFIPARSGSKGIKNKNIALLNDYPLFVYSIAAASMCPDIASVIVSTDSEDYAYTAKKYGADVPFLRPAEYSTDSSTDLDAVQHYLDWSTSTHKQIPSLIIHLRPTTPLRNPQVISEAIQFISQHPNSSSLRSSHLAPESPSKWFKKKGTYYEPFDSHVALEDSNAPRQQFENTYIPNGYVDILKPDYISKENSLHGPNILAFETEPCIEIDSPHELDYAHYYINKSNTFSSLTDYLKRHHD